MVTKSPERLLRTNTRLKQIYNNFFMHRASSKSEGVKADTRPLGGVRSEPKSFFGQKTEGGGFLWTHMQILVYDADGIFRLLNSHFSWFFVSLHLAFLVLFFRGTIISFLVLSALKKYTHWQILAIRLTEPGRIIAFLHSSQRQYCQLIVDSNNRILSHRMRLERPHAIRRIANICQCVGILNAPRGRAVPK